MELPAELLAMNNGLDEPGFESPQGNEIFLFSKSSRQALGLIQPPTQWAARFLTGGKVAGG
jgi:hypothetical protein